MVSHNAVIQVIQDVQLYYYEIKFIIFTQDESFVATLHIFMQTPKDLTLTASLFANLVVDLICGKKQ